MISSKKCLTCSSFSRAWLWDIDLHQAYETKTRYLQPSHTVPKTIDDVASTDHSWRSISHLESGPEYQPANRPTPIMPYPSTSCDMASSSQSGLYGAVAFLYSSPSTLTLLSAVAGPLNPSEDCVPNLTLTPPLPTLTVRASADCRSAVAPPTG